MTGEITLSGPGAAGRRHPREGARGARATASRPSCCRQMNEQDLAELPAEVRNDMTFVPARTLEDVLEDCACRRAGVPIRRSPAASAVAVVFYISGHGFGHASRQIEIINAVGARTSRLADSSSAPALPAGCFNERPRCRSRSSTGPCDTGVVQIDSVRLDEQDNDRPQPRSTRRCRARGRRGSGAPASATMRGW